MANQKRKKLPAAEFQISEKVRVRHGVKDGDYPDMPLGGWAGTIAEFSDNGIYTVRWSEETRGNWLTHEEYPSPGHASWTDAPELGSI